MDKLTKEEIMADIKPTLDKITELCYAHELTGEEGFCELSMELSRLVCEETKEKEFTQNVMAIISQLAYYVCCGTSKDRARERERLFIDKLLLSWAVFILVFLCVFMCIHIFCK